MLSKLIYVMFNQWKNYFNWNHISLSSIPSFIRNFRQFQHFFHLNRIYYCRDGMDESQTSGWEHLHYRIYGLCCHRDHRIVILNPELNCWRKHCICTHSSLFTLLSHQLYFTLSQIIWMHVFYSIVRYN